MKYLYVAAVAFLLHAVSFAATTNLNVTLRKVPFSCENAVERAKSDLIEKCQQQNGNLVRFVYEGCTPDGDDGGYVNYVALTAYGECQVN